MVNIDRTGNTIQLRVQLTPEDPILAETDLQRIVGPEIPSGMVMPLELPGGTIWIVGQA